MDLPRANASHGPHDVASTPHRRPVEESEPPPSPVHESEDRASLEPQSPRPLISAFEHVPHESEPNSPREPVEYVSRPDFGPPPPSVFEAPSDDENSSIHGAGSDDDAHRVPQQSLQRLNAFRPAYFDELENSALDHQPSIITQPRNGDQLVEHPDGTVQYAVPDPETPA